MSGEPVHPVSNRQPAADDDLAAARFLMVLLLCTLAVMTPAPLTPSGLGTAPIASGTAPPEGESPDQQTVSLAIAGEAYSLWIADDRPSWTTGLAGVTAIPEYGGMLFVYPYPRLHQFYMAHCHADIDVIFLDRRNRIVSMHEMKAEPPIGENEQYDAYLRRLPRYSSGRPAQYAIELKAGSIRRLGLQTGQVIDLDQRN